MNTNNKNRLLLIMFVMFFLVFIENNIVKADVKDEVDQRNAKIEEIKRQITDYEQQIQLNQGKSKTLSNEIARLNATINKVQLEIRNLDYSIEDTNNNIRSTQDQIFDTQIRINAHKDSLAVQIQTMYEIDQKTLTQVMLQHDKLSDFFTDLNAVVETQENLKLNIDFLKEAKNNLEEQHLSLEEQRGELEGLRSIQAYQKSNLANNKNEKDKLLDQTKGEEAKYQDLVVKGQRNIAAIQNEISSLLQNGLTVTDAVEIAEQAALGAGIRPAFLLAEMEVETRTGKFLGSGNFYEDMYQCYIRLGTVYYPNKKDYYFRRAEHEKQAFEAITREIGLDPNSVKVSAEPSYGCGGAMGVAQFIPTTWNAYKDRVAQITGHYPPNPWNFLDGFTAAAIKLADAGATAKTREAEIRASKIYISGNGSCKSNICNHYADLVQETAARIEANL